MNVVGVSMLSSDNKKYFDIAGYDLKYVFGADGFIYNARTEKRMKKDVTTGCSHILKGKKLVKLSTAKLYAELVLRSRASGRSVYPRDGDYNRLSGDNILLTHKTLRRASTIEADPNYRAVNGCSSYYVNIYGWLFKSVNDHWVHRSSPFKKNEKHCFYINKKIVSTARVVALAFLTDDIPDEYISFIKVFRRDGNKKNNNVSNLYILFSGEQVSSDTGKIVKVSEDMYSANLKYGNEYYRLGFFSDPDEARLEIKCKLKELISKDISRIKNKGEKR